MREGGTYDKPAASCGLERVRCETRSVRDAYRQLGVVIGRGQALLEEQMYERGRRVENEGWNDEPIRAR